MASPMDSLISLASLGGNGLELGFFAIGLLAKLIRCFTFEKNSIDYIGLIRRQKAKRRVSSVGEYWRATGRGEPTTKYEVRLQAALTLERLKQAYGRAMPRPIFLSS